MRNPAMRICSALVLAFALAACGGGGGGNDEPSASPTDRLSGRPRSTGTLRILEPQQGATIAGSDVLVRVEVTGARILTGAATTDVRPDTGHIHVKLDGETQTLLAGDRYTIEGVKPGKHIITVEFAAADHGPFSPPVVQTVTITTT